MAMYYSMLSFLCIQKKAQPAKQFETETPVRWVQHQDVYGTYYYEDTINNTVTWTAPVNEECIAWSEPQA